MTNSLFERTMVTAGAQQVRPPPHPPSRLLQHASRHRSPRSSLVMSTSMSCFMTGWLPMLGGWHSCSVVGIATGSRNWPCRPRTPERAEEMREVIKSRRCLVSHRTVDCPGLAMRLEAPGFVGEALLVAKKMGYENYSRHTRTFRRTTKTSASSRRLVSRFLRRQPNQGDLISFG